MDRSVLTCVSFFYSHRGAATPIFFTPLDGLAFFSFLRCMSNVISAFPPRHSDARLLAFAFLVTRTHTHTHTHTHTLFLFLDTLHGYQVGHWGGRRGYMKPEITY